MREQGVELMGEMESRREELARASGLRRRSQARADAGPRLAPTTTTTTSPATLPFFLAGLCFLIAAIGLVSFIVRRDDSVVNLLPSHITSLPSAGSLDQTLHPKEHTTRSATTLRYSWKVTSGFRYPDGVKKRVYLINDAFPGPTVEARSGDSLVIEVENALESDEGLAIHWHGLYMRGANHMDGAVGFTQNAMPAGTNFTYEFNVSDAQAGTFWYHAHDQVQRGDGLFGGLIVHRPQSPDERTDARKYGYDGERLLMIGDWYHRPASQVLAWYMRAASFGNEPVPDSLLINGLGAYDCAKAVRARPVECVQIEGDALPTLQFDRRKRYRLRVVNTGTLAGFTLGISGASVTVVEVDGGNPVSGDPAESVGIIYPGQRADLILEWRRETGPTSDISTALRIELDREDFKYPNPALTRVQRFPIELSDTPSTSARIQDKLPDPATQMIPRFDLTSVKASLPLASPLEPTADQTLLLYANTLKLSRLSNVPHGFMNHTSWRPQSSPPGPLISLPRSSWDAHQFVPRIPLPASASSASSSSPKPLSVAIVLNNLDDGGHPFHLHGHSFHVLQTHAASAGNGWGGSYDPFSATPEPPGGALELAQPVQRDTVFVPRRGYVVLRFAADNPGVWMLHCHVLWHQASGMAMGVDVGGDEGGA